MASSEQSNQKYIQEYVGPCPYCGFHLQRPKTNKCSECGNTLEITLKAPFKLTGWLLAFVGICSSIAIYVTHIAFNFIGGYANGGHVSWNIIVPESVVLLVLVFSAFGWFYMYQWFSERSPTTKRIAGSIGCLLPFVLYQVMVWGIYW